VLIVIGLPLKNDAVLKLFKSTIFITQLITYIHITRIEVALIVAEHVKFKTTLGIQYDRI